MSKRNNRRPPAQSVAAQPGVGVAAPLGGAHEIADPAAFARAAAEVDPRFAHAAAALVTGTALNQSGGRGYTQGGPTGYGRSDGPPYAGPAPQLVHRPISSLIDTLRHPATTPVERVWRKLPEAGFFRPELTPARPITFDIGNLQVPSNMMGWITDYRFSAWRQSGIDAGDVFRAEDGQFSARMGFDLTIDEGIRQGNIAYQLDPTPINVGSSGYQPQIPQTRDNQPPGYFEENASRSFGGIGGAGSSLLPLRSQRQGPRQGPFSFIVESDHTIFLKGTVFRELTSPIAFIQGQIAGFLLHVSVAKMILARIEPK